MNQISKKPTIILPEGYQAKAPWHRKPLHYFVDLELISDVKLDGMRSAKKLLQELGAKQNGPPIYEGHIKGFNTLVKGYAAYNPKDHVSKEDLQRTYIKEKLKPSSLYETVNFELKQIFSAVKKPNNYLRINSKLKIANSEMDDASDNNIENLQKEGIRIAHLFDKELDMFVKKLIKLPQKLEKFLIKR